MSSQTDWRRYRSLPKCLVGFEIDDAESSNLVGILRRLVWKSLGMVFYFTTSEGYTIYMGADKYENEDLIRYGVPEDFW